MSYTVEIMQKNILPLPDSLCAELGFQSGDILIFKINKTRSEIILQKHDDQSLSDEQIFDAGNLARVIPFQPDE
jgi:hypothetical protein